MLSLDNMKNFIVTVIGLIIIISSFIHSFIADIYIAPLQVGLLKSAPNPSAANNVVLSCCRNFWENTLGSCMSIIKKN